MSSKADRRKFLKYIGAGLVAAAAGGAGYYLYGRQPTYSTTTTQTVTIPKGWETATTWLKKTSLAGTTATLPRREWWKNTKVATASVDYWSPEGRQYVEDAGIEAIDWLGGHVIGGTPARAYLKYEKTLIDEIHSKGLMTRAHEVPFQTYCGDFLFTANGEIYTPGFDSGIVGERIRYPLRGLYQSPYWSRYFGEKWRNPDGSIMEDPIEGGCARSLSHEIVQFPDWGLTLISIHNPYYLGYVKKCLEIDVDMGFDGVNLDNINCAPFGFWLGGDFSPWGEYRFKEHLSKTYSEKELLSVGIRDLDKFVLRKYLLDMGYNNVNVDINDPLMKSWSRFEYRAFGEFLSAICEHLRSYARSKGRDWFAVSGNIFNLRGYDSPLSVLGTNYFDIIWLEETGEFVPPARISLVTRQGWAFSKFRKPVWQHLCAATVELGKYLKNDYANLLGIICAQAYSVGAVYLADRQYWIAFTPPTFRHAMGPKSSKLISSYCRFVHENKRYLLEAQPCRCGVGLVYSLPTMMMRFYPSFGYLGLWEWDRALMGVSHVLDRDHTPFGFVMLGDPEFWDDSDVLSSLSGYNVLVVSSAEVVTGDQADAIRSFVENGGGLLSFGTIATRDENYNPRKTPILQDLTKPGLHTVREGKTLRLSGNPGYLYWRNVVEDRKEDPSNYKTIRDAVASLSGGPRIIDTNAPDNVSVSLLQQGDRSFQVHVVNLDYDESDDSVKEKDSIRIKARLPNGFPIEGKEGRLLTPDGDSYSERLEYSASDGYVELEVPLLRIYSIAAIYDPKYST